MPGDLSVAIIIVTYRSARLTIECLRSIQLQLGSPGLAIRAIVVDNASGDFATVNAAIRDNGWSSWATCLLAPMNGGFAYGNNIGMQVALSTAPVSYFYLVNPDTELRAGAIGTLVEFMESHLDVGIAGGSFENRDGSDWPMAFRFPSLISEFLSGVQIGMFSRLLASSVVPREMTKKAQPTDWICGAAMMIRASVARSIGGLDENYFLYFEETDLCRRALQAGFPTWYVPESRVMHILGQSTNVTGAAEGSRRLPSYWFESRRRYFAVTFGVRKAMLIDVVGILSLSLGVIKQALMGKRPVPFLLRDLMTHSILRKRNREIPPFKSSLIRVHLN
jgi:GT2 family glycosyltransferase